MYVKSSQCPNSLCSSDPKTFRYIKKGYYRTGHDRQQVPRYQCKACGKYFSTHTVSPTYQQKKPALNKQIYNLYVSGMNQRRIARVLGIDRKTVTRKFLFMARRARTIHEEKIKSGKLKTSFVQFDEMETFEHTRLKPLSIAIAVRPKTGEIIDLQVASMKCHGKLSSVARRLYGHREDTREAAREDVLKAVSNCSKEKITIASDGLKTYKNEVSLWVPNATLVQKKRNPNETYDRLFSLNLLCAKLRNDLSRMGRKTWVTTKAQWALQAHLDLYIAWNNGYKLS